MNNKKKSKEDVKNEYKIKDVFSKNSEIDINEILKKCFLTNLKITKLN